MAALWAVPSPAARAEDLPACAPGWKAERIAQAPGIVYPTVVCCAPDGRIFLGEDPMDMPNPSDKPSDKILTIYPDGHTAVFASNLYAVFGLQYIDGKLYVHHSPKFSVFDDHDGVGANRVDLIQSDNPHPWLPSFNDHIPSNCRLAMDGYLYISTGDKGLFGLTGPDGRRLELHGGGVYRMRPDGTGLEIYCTGTRNFLEVAINSEDELFTYDNTDDGVGWWTRVTHMVDGGYYGYPYDYLVRRPYTLWMMGDFGGGAPTGACSYNEDALPVEYHGNLFLCDWGRGQVLRLKVARTGATYRIVSRVQTGKLDFISKGRLDEFRPVGITVSPDGKSFYVSDWAKATWKHNDVIGRLYKITFTGKTIEAPKPVWYIPAASGKPFRASDDELLHALAHPSENVRLAAQRRLAQRGAEVAPALSALVENPSAPAPARWSAIWTLDALDGGRSGRAAILDALRAADLTVRMQAERELGERRVQEAQQPLIALLRHSNAAVRFRAATALGRIGDAASVPALMDSLDETDFFTHYAVFTALHRIGVANAAAWPAMLNGLASRDAAVREGVTFAMRETYDTGLVAALARSAADRNLPLTVRTNVFSLLASLAKRPPPWDGTWWNTMPAKNPPPAKTADWAGTPLAAAGMRPALRDSAPPVLRIAFDWLRATHDVAGETIIINRYAAETDNAVRAGMIRALAGSKLPGASNVVGSILKDRASPAPLLAAAISTAETMDSSAWNAELLLMARRSSDQEVLTNLYHLFGVEKLPASIPLLGAAAFSKETVARDTSLEALENIGSPEAVRAIVRAVENASPYVQRHAIFALARLKARPAIPFLKRAMESDLTHDLAVTALAQMDDPSLVEIYLDQLSSKNSVLREACEKALQAVGEPALPAVEARLRAGNLPDSAIAALQRIYQDDPQARKSALLRKNMLRLEPVNYEDYALSHDGMPARGRTLFHDLNGVGCIRCHSIDGKGGQIGPDLSAIHAKYNRRQIIEAILYPSKDILDGYQQVFIGTRNGEEYSGIVRSETPAAVVLVDGTGTRHTIQVSDIQSRRLSRISLMPEDLQTGLSLSEFADLIAYLENSRLALTK